MKAIRLKCLDCVWQQEKLIRECPIMTCALWPYRMGRYPKAGRNHATRGRRFSGSKVDLSRHVQ